MVQAIVRRTFTHSRAVLYGFKIGQIMPVVCSGFKPCHTLV